MGYLVNNMVDTGGIPMYLLTPILEFVEVNNLVELGTAGGNSTREAAKHFKNVITIELIENRAVVDETLENVTWLTGDTVNLLPKIIDKLIADKKEKQDHNYTIFFIDSHYSDPEPNESEYPECPLMEELDAIAMYNEDSIIIIDDARLFLGQPPHPLDPRKWPKIQDVFYKINTLFPEYYTTITDDYIISLPEKLIDPVNAEWRGNFNIRYPNAADKLKVEVKNVYSALKNYINEPT